MSSFNDCVLAAVVAFDHPMMAVLKVLWDYGKLTTRSVLRHSKTGWEEGHKALNRAAALGLVKRWNDVWQGHAVVFNKLTERGERIVAAVLEAWDLYLGANSRDWELGLTGDETVPVASVTGKG